MMHSSALGTESLQTELQTSAVACTRAPVRSAPKTCRLNANIRALQSNTARMVNHGQINTLTHHCTEGGRTCLSLLGAFVKHAPAARHFKNAVNYGTELYIDK